MCGTQIRQDFGAHQLHPTEEPPVRSSRVAENSAQAKQNTNFDRTEIIDKIQPNCPCIIMEAIKIKIHPNFNREDGHKLSEI
jgi:hypothetical protein